MATGMEIITTGEEVLQGQIIDSNAAWLSARLQDHGLELNRRSTVGDRLEDLVALFHEAAGRSRLVIVNGGLGPTSDDLTARAAAEAAGLPLEVHTAWLAQLQQRLQAQGGELRESHRLQARLPRGVEAIPNPVGSACGFWLDIGAARFCFTPGPPVELKPMFQQYILPRLLAEYGDGLQTRLARLHVFGRSEGSLAPLLDTLPLPEGVRLGYRPHLPTVEVKVMSQGTDATLDALHQQVVAQVRQRLGAFVYAEDDDDLPAVIHRMMLQQGLSLSLAESCTAGWAAGELVRQAGSSRWLRQAWVTYSEQAKQRELGVPARSIEQHGVISPQVAAAMAEGARQRAGTDLALAITGQAGPVEPGTRPPAGTTCVALAHAGGVMAHGWQHRDLGRNGNRKVQTWLLLDLLRRYLAGQTSEPDYDLARPWPNP